MTAIGELLEQLDPDELRQLAERLRPFMASDGARDEHAAYTPKTLAAELGRSERSIRAAIARGELAAVRRGKGWVIGAEAVAAWAQAPRASATRLHSRRDGKGPGPARRALTVDSPRQTRR